jgi:hypothetical protein
MGVGEPKASELIATARKSTFPLLFVEGKTDMKVFRSIQKRMGILQVTFQPCHARSALLAVFDQRHELSGHQIAFFADRDLWYYTNVPSEFQDVSFTTGYSIENDLYFDGSGHILRYLTPAERAFLEELLHNVSHWFAFEIESNEGNRAPEYSKHSILNPDIFPPKATNFLAAFLDSRGYSNPSDAIAEMTTRDSFSGLPGKIVFDCVFKVMKDFREKDDTVYAHTHLHDMCIIEGTAEENPHSRLNQIIAALQAKLA